MNETRLAEAGLFSMAVAGTDLPVTVIRSARRKRTISLGLSRGRLVVRAPQSTPMSFIQRTVEARADWIARQLRTSPTAQPFVSGGLLPFLGRRLRLEVVSSVARGEPSAQLEGDVLVVPGPDDPDATPSTTAAVIASWYRSQAEGLLSAVAAKLATATGLRPARVLVRTQRARWGSCGPDGTIRLSWRLVMLPPEFIDLVVLHELTHLQHRNHGPQFWAALEAIAPGARSQSRELRRISRELPDF